MLIAHKLTSPWSFWTGNLLGKGGNVSLELTSKFSSFASLFAVCSLLNALLEMNKAGWREVRWREVRCFAKTDHLQEVCGNDS